MKATGWKMAIGLGAIAGTIGYARARARRRQRAASAVPRATPDDGDTLRYHGHPGPTVDKTLPEELRTILSPAFAQRSRHP